MLNDKKTTGIPGGFPALIPFFIFVLFYLGLSIYAGDFYKVPMPVAFIVASAAAVFMNRRYSLADKVEVFAGGMGESNIMIMCMVFILAGAFAAVAKGMGAVDAAVVISRTLIPDRMILCGIFLVSCFISLAIGTSCGTIATLVPIALGLGEAAGIPVELGIGAVVGGAMFGDNMSMISDTTIAATRTQGVAMRDKFLMNLKIALPAALVTLVIYFFSAGNSFSETLKVLPVSGRDYLLTVPYLLVLLCALCGMNVMAVLFCGMVLSGVLGMAAGKFDFWKFLELSGSGSLGMSETLIVALLAGGLLSLIRFNGGISYLLGKVGKFVSGRRGCEVGIALLVTSVNLFTANNTVAIVIAGPLAAELAGKYKCDPRRIATILDVSSCVIQGLIPYGAQILIAVGVAHGSGMKVSTLDMIGNMYYQLIMGIFLIVFIIIGSKKITGRGVC